MEKIIQSHFPEKRIDLKNNAIKTDMALTDNYEQLINEEDVVINAAGFVSFDDKDYNTLKISNFKNTATLVNVCIDRKVKKLIHLSSVTVLSNKNKGKQLNEKDFNKPTSAQSFYSQSKYFGELEVWRGIAEGLNAVILRPSVIFGFHDWNNGSNAIFKRCYSGLKFYTDGATGFTTAEFLSKAVIYVAENDTQHREYIINSKNLFYKNLFEIICKAFYKNPPKVRAGKILTYMYWRIESLICFFTGKKALITKHSANSAATIKSYDGSRFIEESGLKTNDFEKELELICKTYLHQKEIVSLFEKMK